MTQVINPAVTPPNGWDAAQQTRHASFLQSSWWGTFLQRQHKTVLYIEQPRWAALVMVQKTPLGSYWLVPYGPTADTTEDLSHAIAELHRMAEAANMLYVRIEPQQFFDSAQIKGIRRAAHDYNPRFTVISDLTKPKEALHHSLSSTNRSLVNQMPRNGIQYTESTNPDDITVFLRLQAEVSQRTDAIFREAEYFCDQAQTLMPGGSMRLYIAYQEGKPVAATITHDYAGTTTYTYAASAYAARKKSVGNTIVWYAMMAAKERGQERFDFSGIAGPDAKPSDPWLGFTFFKRKFGGEETEYMGTWDIPLKPQYYVLRMRTTSLYVCRDLKRRLKKKS